MGSVPQVKPGYERLHDRELPVGSRAPQWSKKIGFTLDNGESGRKVVNERRDRS
jgi:hypothetical protein